MVTAHMIVKNEESFIWYSVSSIINHVDLVMIWDTGSSDKTNEIIRKLKDRYNNKINYKEVGMVNKSEYTKVRQQMLRETESGWIFILDGDEIWWDDSIRSVTDFIKNESDNFETIIVKTYNLVGDMFHYQEQKAGKYKFGNKVGHYALRFFKTSIPGVHVDADYGKEGFFDIENKPIQDRDKNKQKFIDVSYIHTSHLKRSSKDREVMQRAKKMINEIGFEFPLDYYYPEVFFRERPDIVPNVWNNMDLKFKIRALFETPLRRIKRRI